MKTTTLLTIAHLLMAPLAQASNVVCGANIERSPGSQVYDKNVFSEVAETAKAKIRYVLADGSIVKAEGLSPDDHAKIAAGTIAVGFNTAEGEWYVFSGRVKKDPFQQISFENLALAKTINGGTPHLLANGISVSCKEL